ncbi:hypothetical protein PoB_004358200 [Plakobranchus ocellatus]|uniref:Uncharacterized protein n=1 Tax=Plakobranchus ocellatus TaxID=259542 RepID=A0AAV4BCA5_9GAST|nr:hypothetical protein PoB_004358200 [Plakobranchus ocellatus]
MAIISDKGMPSRESDASQPQTLKQRNSDNLKHTLPINVRMQKQYRSYCTQCMSSYNLQDISRAGHFPRASQTPPAHLQKEERAILLLLTYARHEHEHGNQHAEFLVQSAHAKEGGGHSGRDAHNRKMKKSDEFNCGQLSRVLFST